MGLAAEPRLIFLLLLLCFAAELSSSSAQKLKTFTEQYGRPFDESYYPIFAVEDSATISYDALQITPDSHKDEFNLKNRSGRVFLKRSFKLWEAHSQQPRVRHVTVRVSATSASSQRHVSKVIAMSAVNADLSVQLARVLTVL
ncbi:hypothetical protein Vadar_007515 [Vaccinium darrowii]|uniref:Uncharacterized protein n=1 Tax=Vaccinium darrowii TaxID=229202 RepID=A0ACB7YCE0_9ERIC|nr:hypothetical protein Vadar_007515 [Vaccinium darrowii]